MPALDGDKVVAALRGAFARDLGRQGLLHGRTLAGLAMSLITSPEYLDHRLGLHVSAAAETK